MISHEKVSPFYGWMVVAASTLITFGIFGTSGSFGVFLKPIGAELGWTRAMVSGAMSTVSGVSGLIGIIAGRLTDKYGGKMLIAVGALVGGFGYLLMSHAHSLWQLYLYLGVMVGICSGACWAPVIANVSKWFTEKRVLVLGITTGGIAMGQMLIPPLAAYFINIYNWRPAYVILAITVWVTAIPVVILLGRKPPQSTPVSKSLGSNGTLVEGKKGKTIHSRGWSATEAAKTLPFWMLMVTGFVTAAGFYFMQVHIVAFATDLKIASTSAALILTFMNVGSIVAQLLVWTLALKIGSRFTFIILLCLQAFALFCLMKANSLWMFIMLGSVFGLGFGATTTIRMSMVSEFFGTRSLGTILGLVTASWALGGVIGPFLAGHIFDISHSYNLAFLSGGLLLMVGVVAGYFLKAPDG